MLQQAGITSLEQLAAMTEDDLNRMSFPNPNPNPNIFILNNNCVGLEVVGCGRMSLKRAMQIAVEDVLAGKVNVLENEVTRFEWYQSN